MQNFRIVPYNSSVHIIASETQNCLIGCLVLLQRRCIQYYFVSNVDSDAKLLQEKILVLGWFAKMYYNQKYKMSCLTHVWMKGKVIVSYQSDTIKLSSSFHLATGLTTLFLLRLLLLLLITFSPLLGIFAFTYRVLFVKLENIQTQIK